jgi:hypothetical protein
MPGRQTDLTDFLTASGLAMGRANGRLTGVGAPTILREFRLEVNYFARFSLPATVDSLLIQDADLITTQLLPVLDLNVPTLSITATYIAAPSLVPVPPT